MEHETSSHLNFTFLIHTQKNMNEKQTFIIIVTYDAFKFQTQKLHISKKKVQ